MITRFAKAALLLMISMSIASSACTPDRSGLGMEGSSLSSLAIGKFEPGSGQPSWSQLEVKMARQGGDNALISRKFVTSDFQSGTANNLSLTIAQGTYTINLTYTDTAGQIVYQECSNIHTKQYVINTPTYAAQIDLCKTGSTTATGSVAVNKQTTGSGVSTASGSPPDCHAADYGLPQTMAPGNTTQFPDAGDLSGLPTLGSDASASQIKQFVTTVYHTFSVLPQIYEGQLGLTESEALAFMYGDMSRESGGNTSSGAVGWRINLETGNGSAGHAWGPFQAAVTNFTGGGYDSIIEKYSGLPIPSMSQFKDPAVSTYAGMKRLADGILNSMKSFGAGKPAKQYLLGTLADHNTGHPEDANDQNWLNSYGNEVLRLMVGYQQNDNLTNDKVYWTGESSADWGCP